MSVSLRRPEVALSGASERLQNGGGGGRVVVVVGGGINLCSVHAKAEEPLLSALQSSLSSGSPPVAPAAGAAGVTVTLQATSSLEN